MAKSRRSTLTSKEVSATNARSFRTFLLMAEFAAKEIGARIAEARTLRGLTQENLAEMLSISTRSLQDYEAGVRIPYKHFRDLGRMLKKPEEWFLYGKADEVEEPSEAMAAQLDRIERALEALVTRLERGDFEESADG